MAKIGGYVPLTRCVCETCKTRLLGQEKLNNKWNLHGGKTTMLSLNLSGHDIFKKRNRHLTGKNTA